MQCNNHNNIYNQYCIEYNLYLYDHRLHQIILLNNVVSTTNITNQLKE